MEKHTILITAILFNMSFVGCGSEPGNHVQVANDLQETVDTAKTSVDPLADIHESRAVSKEVSKQKKDVSKLKKEAVKPKQRLQNVSGALTTLKNKSASAGEVETAINSLVAHGEEGLESLWIEYLNNSSEIHVLKRGDSTLNKRAEAAFVAFKKDGLDFLGKQIQALRKDELDGTDTRKFKQMSSAPSDIMTLMLWKDSLMTDLDGIRYQICGSIGRPDLSEKIEEDREEHREKMSTMLENKF